MRPSKYTKLGLIAAIVYAANICESSRIVRKDFKPTDYDSGIRFLETKSTCPKIDKPTTTCLMNYRPATVLEDDPRLKRYTDIVTKPILNHKINDDQMHETISSMLLDISNSTPKNFIIAQLKNLIPLHVHLRSWSYNTKNCIYKIGLRFVDDSSSFLEDTMLTRVSSDWETKQSDNSPIVWAIEFKWASNIAQSVRHASNLTMGIFTLAFSMVRRKGLGVVTGEILSYLWEHYHMSTLINGENFKIQSLLGEYRKFQEKNEIPPPKDQLRIKNLRSLCYLNLLPLNMRNRNFMITCHELAKKWQQGDELKSMGDVFQQLDDETRFALADEAFTIVITDAIEDFDKPETYLDFASLWLYIEHKFKASLKRINDIFYGRIVRSDIKQGVFDISLLPKIFRWSEMPALEDSEDAKVAAQELITYLEMLFDLSGMATSKKLKDGKIPNATGLNRRQQIVAQTIDPSTYTLLDALLSEALRHDPIYGKPEDQTMQTPTTTSTPTPTPTSSTDNKD